MSNLFVAHQQMLEEAVDAVSQRGFWSVFPEVPSGRFYGEAAKEEGARRFENRVKRPFDMGSHPEQVGVGQERSPYGFPLDVLGRPATA